MILSSCLLSLISISAVYVMLVYDIRPFSDALKELGIWHMTFIQRCFNVDATYMRRHVPDECSVIVTFPGYSVFTFAGSSMTGRLKCVRKFKTISVYRHIIMNFTRLHVHRMNLAFAVRISLMCPFVYDAVYYKITVRKHTHTRARA